MKNYSKQREEVLEVLKESYDHPTAEEIYLRVKNKNSTSSKGTVYRNLSVLVELDYILKIPMSDGPDRYDFVRKKHNHIICKRCGKVVDFEYDFDSNKAKEKINEMTNIKTDIDTVIVFGICTDCEIKIKN